MPHVICKLKFNTAVHFGSDSGGASLSGVSMNFRADVLFSALFQALMPLGRSDELLQVVQRGTLSFSDALPWHGNILFLPRPVGIFAKPGDHRDEDPSQRKLLKKISFIPADSLGDFLAGNADLKALHALNHFGAAIKETRVNTRDGADPLPYQVGGFRFDEDCGLYLAVSCDAAAFELFELGIKSLSADGIGGRTSSGWGKFSYDIVPASDDWRRRLEDENAPRQMLLSTALPAEDEISAALEGAWYNVVRRGGFTSSPQSHPLKKQTVYLLGAGSTFQRRFRGAVLDVGLGMPHPVWRYARALFVGVEA